MSRQNEQLSEKKLITDILDNFDFEKCERVMSFLKWTWGFTNQPVTVERLKENAIYTLTKAIELVKKNESHHYPSWISTGGLRATAWRNR